MPTQLANDFREQLNTLHVTLRALPAELADTQWRVGGWTRKQIVGHLLDSATNNRQRFVRAALDGHYKGPRYSQDGWVAAHGYAHLAWATLLQWWQVEHDILIAIVDQLRDEQFDTQCVLGDEEPVSLRFLIEDYIVHQKWHFAQLAAGIE